MSKIIARLLSPLGVVIVVCFFLPWITVSCNTMPIIDGASGIDIANPMVVMGERTEGARELYLVLAGGVLMAVAGLAFWAGQRNALASTICLLSALVVTGVLFLYWQQVQATLHEDEFAASMINIVWEGGFWGVSLSGALGLVAALVSYAYPSPASGASPPHSTHSTSSPEPSSVP